MKPTILVTDTLFIFPEHEEKLKAAGFAVERLNKTEATEAELIEAVKDKVGYIMGGVEHLTAPFFEAANELKVITFTGADWAHFMPGHQTATDRGIRITNTPGNTTVAVSEFTITLLLMMLRRTLELGGPGEEAFITTQSLPDVHIGVIGMGRIGERVTRLLLALGAKHISYWNRTRKPQLEAELNINYLELEELVASCDVITNHVSSQAGELVEKGLLAKAKEGLLLINTGGAGAINLEALYEQIMTRGARAAFDIGGGIKEERLRRLPLSKWYCTNDNAGFNTRDCLQMASDMAVESVINVLTTGDDQYVVNK